MEIKTFARQNNVGLIEIVDLHSGAVLCVQASTNDLLAGRLDELTEYTMPNGDKVFLEKGISPLTLGKIRNKKFSPMIADLICQSIVEGLTLVKACEKHNQDYATICKWRREQKEFKDAIETARLDRAETFHDKAIDTAESSIDTKLKVETLKWAASLGDPAKFGNTTKIVGDKNAPISFMLDTGIRRPGDPGFVAPPEAVDHGKVLEENPPLGDGLLAVDGGFEQ